MTLTQEAKPSLRSILIVDDDDGVRENLAELFDVVGYRVITAANANEALDHLGQESVDVLLTDYRMPGPNGVELVARCNPRTAPRLADTVRLRRHPEGAVHLFDPNSGERLN